MPQKACNKCTLGCMDNNNPHLRSQCLCDCHTFNGDNRCDDWIDSKIDYWENSFSFDDPGFKECLILSRQETKDPTIPYWLTEKEVKESIWKTNSELEAINRYIECFNIDLG